MGFLYPESNQPTIKSAMSVSEIDFQYMVDCLERDVSTLLVKEHNMSIHQALDTFHNSLTYVRLKNPATGLYFQSSRYVLSILQDEM